MQGRLFDGYRPLAGPDEMVGTDGQPRAAYAAFAERLGGWGQGDYLDRQARADLALRNSGITFTVYADQAGTERIFPFSLIPRIIAAAEWAQIEAGLTQRVTALNLFLKDIYNEQRVVKDGVIPGEIVFGAADYNLRMVGFTPPLGVYAHIVGTDLVRDVHGQFVVLEDNLRTPSGVSYVLENRTVMLRVASDLFPAEGDAHVAPVSDYSSRLLSMLGDVRPAGVERGEVNAVILTPGSYNSAYFEHTFLAQQMGVQLVEAADLIVHDERVYLRATSGMERVHVIYRRIDDAFLDPLAFRPDSVLGVAGLADAYRAGNVTLVNAMGTGVADDKVVYRFVPDFIRYYLGQEPIIPNVETYVGALPQDLELIRAHLRELVLKPANASGGYGIVIGPQATDAQLRDALATIEADPRGWVAQPLQEFSTIPTFADGRLAPRRCDIRPYVLTGESTWVLPGGLTRVALREGSYVVNSSQGGGSKDTWVLAPGAGVGEGGRLMLSRVAENLYWMGRYLERAENAARMADVDYHASIESAARGPVGGLWESLISATGARAAYAAAREADHFLSPADFLILADANANSIRSTVRQARTLARAVREHVSREVWEEVNELYFTMDAHTRVQEAEIYDLCRTVKHRVETAIGLYENTALHDEGREWFRCGLFIERADMTSRILDSKYHVLLPSTSRVGGTLDRLQWIAVLKSASAWEAFRKVSRVDADGARVAEMLIFNPDFPRGLLFCVRALRDAYRNAVAETPAAHAVHAERLITLLDLDLSALNIGQVFEQGLHEFLSDFQRRLVAVHLAVTEQVFRVAPEHVA